MLPGLIHWVSLLSGDPVDGSCFWTPSELWDAEDLAIEIGDHSCAWTDGSLDPMLWQMFFFLKKKLANRVEGLGFVFSWLFLRCFCTVGGCPCIWCFG